MKAITKRKYGAVDELRLENIDIPTPKDDEVLIRIHASSINKYDWCIVIGSPFLVRLREGLFKPKNFQLGCDVAGEIEALGNQVDNYKIGNRVCACLADGYGDNAFAEYVCVKKDILALIPDSVSYEAAATVPMAGITALQGLRDVGKIKENQEVLINGASGGVGTFALQIAKASGAKVTAVCHTENLALAKSLCADTVIDYTQKDFTKEKKQYDLIIDIAANYSFSDYKNILKANGICVVIGFSSISSMIKTAFHIFKSRNKSKKVKMLMANNAIKADLISLLEMMESKQIKPVIDQSFPLEEIHRAVHHYEKGHIKGKIVINCFSDSPRN